MRGWQHVKFVITPTVDWLSTFADFLNTWVSHDHAFRLMAIPQAVVGLDGSVPRDDAGLWFT